MATVVGLEVEVPAGTVRVAPPLAHPAPLRVHGLVAGPETFSAGIDEAGAGYVTGLSLAPVPR